VEHLFCQGKYQKIGLLVSLRVIIVFLVIWKRDNVSYNSSFVFYEYQNSRFEDMRQFNK